MRYTNRLLLHFTLLYFTLLAIQAYVEWNLSRQVFCNHRYLLMTFTSQTRKETIHWLCSRCQAYG